MSKIHPKLWKVNLRGRLPRYSPSYVVAFDASEAYNTVRVTLNALDYGFAHERELASVELIAEDHQFTETGSRLFLLERPVLADSPAQ